MKKNILLLEKYIRNPKKGLPQNFFLFLSRVTPLINVDLLIKNKKNETLLTWRDKGEKHPAGWHIPGGIIRFKEKAHVRLRKVARLELGTQLTFVSKPISINEIHLNQKNRSHFISLLYLCFLKKKLSKKLKFNGGTPKSGQWSWFKKAPKNLIKIHKFYKKFIEKKY